MADKPILRLPFDRQVSKDSTSEDKIPSGSGFTSLTSLRTRSTRPSQRDNCQPADVVFMLSF